MAVEDRDWYRNDPPKGDQRSSPSSPRRSVRHDPSGITRRTAIVLVAVHDADVAPRIEAPTLRLDLREGSPRPTAEIAIAQQWVDSGVERKAFGCLHGAERRAAQDNVIRRKATEERGETFSSARIQR